MHEDVIYGLSDGKIIWQPRIGCWYTDKQFAGEALPAPYTGMELPDIFRALGVSDRLYNWYNPCFRRLEHAAVEVRHKSLDARITEIVIETPVGRQVAVQRSSPNNPGTIHVKWEVESEEELKVATWREENATWEWDQERF